jgi:hypothetical protein
MTTFGLVRPAVGDDKSARSMYCGPTGKRSAGKLCAMSRTKRIATAGGRSSGQGLRGDPTYLDLKRRGEKSMLGKRGAVEDV